MNQRLLLYTSLLFHAAILTIYYLQTPKVWLASNKPDYNLNYLNIDDESNRSSQPKPRKILPLTPSESDTDNCEHIQSECVASNILKITEIVQDPDKQFPEILPSTLGLTDLFEYECDDPLDKARFCRYKNMCIFNQWSKGFFSAPYSTSNTTWSLLNAKGKDLRVSHHWYIHPLLTAPRIVKGRYMWVDPRYTNLNRQPGHFYEVGFKLPELRRKFPGHIDGIIVPRTRLNISEYAYQTFRLAFAEEGFQVPPIYFLFDVYPEKLDSICFEELIVPRVTNLYFGSRREADTVRNLALEMCEIPSRENETRLQNIFKIDRDGRQLLNWQELCDLPQLAKYEIRTKCFERLPFCEQVRQVHWGDILIANHGSALVMTAFARKGSVMMDLIPGKLRNPDLKLVAYYASVRYLEFVNMNDTNTGYQFVTDPFYKTSYNVSKFCLTAPIPTILNASDWGCLSYFQDMDITWHPHNFLRYLAEAKRIWNHPNEFKLCELPGRMDYRDPYWATLTEGNWQVCEPDSANYCNSDPQCGLHPDATLGDYDPHIVLTNYNHLWNITRRTKKDTW